MADPSLFRLRVWFKKQGRCAMLAHLEVARTIEREIRRAHLPFAISNGFSPHMRISLGSALPVGVGGTKECFDVFLTQYVSPQRVMEQFASACAPDLAVTSCKYVGPHDPAPSAAYPISKYELVLTRPLAHELSVPETVTVVRKKKTRILQVSDFLVDPPQVSADKTTITFSTKAQSTGATMRPDVFVCALLSGQWPEIDAACQSEGHTLGLGHMAAAVDTLTRIDQRMI